MRSKQPDSRQAIVSAATSLFAKLGFDRASVDEIATRAKVSKAMVYYHFESKNELYVEVLSQNLRSLADRTTEAVTGPLPPDEKLWAFVLAYMTELGRAPFLTRLLMVEMADAARHHTPETMGLVSTILGNLQQILDLGVDAGLFRPTPMPLTYVHLVGPVLFFHAATPMRKKITRRGVVDSQRASEEAFLAHAREFILRALAPH